MIARRLRPDLPFERVAVLLSGGGALGAYQVGVLKVLRAAGLRPAIVSGVSVGAMNAVAWVAQGLEAGPLERIWLGVGPSSIGFHWTTLLLRVAGLFLAALAGLEIVVLLFGSPTTALARLLFHRVPSAGAASWAYDSTAWLVVAALGLVISWLAPRAERRLANASLAGDPERWQRWFGRALAALGVVHLVTWAFALPWPHRFSATVLVVGGIAWLANHRGRSGDWLRLLLARLLPESGGRGLWRGHARRRVLDRLIAEGDRTRLVSGRERLLLAAVAVDTGRMCYFVNWSAEETSFRDAVRRSLGEVEILESAAEVVEAAWASSAIPILFQPVRVHGRDFADAGLFSSQIAHATVAAGPDAMLVVDLSPSVCPPAASREMHLFEVGARLFDVASWRDLRSELGGLGPAWSREGSPASLCVVEPEVPLPGGMLRFDPREAVELVRRGEEDAWRALDRAGWLEAGAARG